MYRMRFRRNYYLNTFKGVLYIFCLSVGKYGSRNLFSQPHAVFLRQFLIANACRYLFSFWPQESPKKNISVSW